MSETTPTPWATNGNRVENRDEHGIVNDGWIIAECFGPDAEANAALIVTAANAHEALVEELTKARALVEKWCHYQGNTRTLFDEHLGPIDAALRLAEGEKE